MGTENPHDTPTATVRWSAPYVTAPQLCAAGLATPSTLDRAAASGALVPVGRRGGRGPRVYSVAAVEAWLRGNGSAPATRPSPPRPTPRRATEPTESALDRIARAASGGAK